MADDGGYEGDVIHRMNELNRASGAMKSVLSNKLYWGQRPRSVYMKE